MTGIVHPTVPSLGGIIQSVLLDVFGDLGFSVASVLLAYACACMQAYAPACACVLHVHAYACIASQMSNVSSVKLPNLDVFLKYGSKYISDISLDANTSIASIKINSMPEFQFNILKNNAERFNINITDDDLILNDGLINGILKVGYSNE